MSKRIFLSAIFSSALVFLLHGQEVRVSGTVIDASTRESIIGGTLMVKNTSSGAVTDIDGNFSLVASPGSVLAISYIGYTTQEITIWNDTTLNIELATSTVLLEQVVVVGYGSQRKVDITGATVSVQGEELAKQPVLTATQALQGKVTGVQIISSGKPGSSPSVRIRGTGTALAGTSALFVVDGILTDDISNINTADIVSLDVLKDASSTAIYGARGANGVVIITTKKGQSGPTRINYNNTIGIREASNLIRMANAEEYANYASAATGTVVSAGGTSTDWYNEILRRAWTQNHNLSFQEDQINIPIT